MRFRAVGRIGRCGWIGRLVLFIWLDALMVGAGAALAAWGGPNPKSNFRIRRLPAICYRRPSSARCINAGVYYLDRAAAKLHQPPYQLPANFTTLTPEEQVFILANLDRIRYKLSPMTGLTRALDRDALGGLPTDPLGVKGDGDPRPTNPSVTQYTANWAGGYPNIVLAYEGWMYDDGYRSPNLACRRPASRGCWGHRHDVLWKFGSTGRAAVGAAAGKDAHGRRGFALLLGKGGARFHPTYIYTWSKAVADGAGRHDYVVHRP